MKKVLLFVLAIMLCASFFVGCGPKDPSSGNTNPGDIEGEKYDTGSFSTLVPKGWKAFDVADVFAEEDNAIDPNALQICKGAESQWDIFTKPYIQINYYGPDTTMSILKDWYDDVEDLEPMELGNYTWNGFTGVSLDYPIAVLWAEDGEHQFQVTIFLEIDNNTLSVNDADVQAILANIQPTA